MLKECAEILAFTISRINSTSLHEQRLPRLWKLAHVSPLSKKLVKDRKRDLRPISPTPCLAKAAKDRLVTDYVKPAVLKVLDSPQHDAVPKSSTTQALFAYKSLLSGFIGFMCTEGLVLKLHSVQLKPRWLPVRVGARSRPSYGKTGDCEQRTLQLT